MAGLFAAVWYGDRYFTCGDRGTVGGVFHTPLGMACAVGLAVVGSRLAVTARRKEVLTFNLRTYGFLNAIMGNNL